MSNLSRPRDGLEPRGREYLSRTRGILGGPLLLVLALRPGIALLDKNYENDALRLYATTAALRYIASAASSENRAVATPSCEGDTGDRPGWSLDGDTRVSRCSRFTLFPLAATLILTASIARMERSLSARLFPSFPLCIRYRRASRTRRNCSRRAFPMRLG